MMHTEGNELLKYSLQVYMDINLAAVIETLFFFTFSDSVNAEIWSAIPSICSNRTFRNLFASYTSETASC